MRKLSKLWGNLWRLEGKEKKGNEAEGKEKKGNEPEGKETEENGDMDEQHDGPEACRVWMKQHEPTIELLPPGTYNKKYPYRCRLCRTRGWPDGRVGELGRLKLYSVKHFVERHLKSDMHLKYARMSEVIRQRILQPWFHAKACLLVRKTQRGSCTCTVLSSVFGPPSPT